MITFSIPEREQLTTAARKILAAEPTISRRQLFLRAQNVLPPDRRRKSVTATNGYAWLFDEARKAAPETAAPAPLSELDLLCSILADRQRQIDDLQAIVSDLTVQVAELQQFRTAIVGALEPKKPAPGQPPKNGDHRA